jgi:hypothetical protein
MGSTENSSKSAEGGGVCRGSPPDSLIISQCATIALLAAAHGRSN